MLIISAWELFTQMREKIAYGVCDCGNWGTGPKDFNESKHFLKCSCGKLMYLDYDDPSPYYPANRKISDITIVKQSEVKH